MRQADKQSFIHSSNIQYLMGLGTMLVEKPYLPFRRSVWKQNHINSCIRVALELIDAYTEKRKRIPQEGIGVLSVYSKGIFEKEWLVWTVLGFPI